MKKKKKKFHEIENEITDIINENEEIIELIKENEKDLIEKNENNVYSDYSETEYKEKIKYEEEETEEEIKKYLVIENEECDETKKEFENNIEKGDNIEEEVHKKNENIFEKEEEEEEKDEEEGVENKNIICTKDQILNNQCNYEIITNEQISEIFNN